MTIEEMKHKYELDLKYARKMLAGSSHIYSTGYFQSKVKTCVDVIYDLEKILKADE